MKQKLTISVDAELISTVKRYARYRGVSLSSLVEQSLRKCLKSVLGSGSNVDMGAPKLVFHEQRETQAT